MKNFIFGLTILMAAVISIYDVKAQGEAMMDSVNIEEQTIPELSVQLIENLQAGESTEEIESILANISESELKEALDTEGKRKAFWLNVYNAYVQIILIENPDLFKDRDSIFGYNFFSSPQVTIAGKELSFDDIEHGIIRRSKNKLSGGYANKIFVGDFEKKFRWEKVDPRIHFALNCGAAACPFIAAYYPERVNEQLDISSKQYLEKTTDYYPEENRVVVNKLMSWFRADFGGKDGSVKMLKEYGIIPQDADPSVDFKEYDWTLELGNYKEI
ncbi:MAG: hypothetical protein CL670_13480 [Balneola sp.]|jgi:hypothetical protein|nr:hypothetical protein [Balneola sp.]MBE80162.1 hypothetical protein [Balneola sp.]HBX64719.1 DUF547 domain-containing protein [Balneolaceae bacterium]|tara:strand:- start:71 stop:889 length:819 start_codon:yes stop_codon:yes gene_type:complete